MKKYLSIVISLLTVLIVFWYVKELKTQPIKSESKENIGSFSRQHSCVRQPNFLKKLHINSAVAIDLSQQKYKGFAFLYGRNLSQALHLKTWEKFDHFSSYALTPNGDMFLAPMPYISIKEKTFEFQKNIYRLDSNSGKLEVWMSFEDVYASSSNPYGVISLDYDCDDNTLWVSAIDETNYKESKGVIYHIDINSKRVLEKIDGIDALTLKLIKSEKGKFLLAGMAKEATLNAYPIVQKKLLKKPIELWKLNDTNEKIRKITIRANTLHLKTIPFSYSLVAQTQEGSIRTNILLIWNRELERFQIKK